MFGIGRLVKYDAGGFERLHKCLKRARMRVRSSALEVGYCLLINLRFIRKDALGPVE